MANAEAKPKRTWRWRRLLQVRLRTLFLLTLAVAIGCAWWLQPKKRERVLAGGALKVRAAGREVEIPLPPDPEAPTLNELLNDPFASERAIHPPGGTRWEEHGAWELLDRSDILLCRGQMDHDVPHGRWTWYYANGRTASTGVVAKNLPVGKWTTYYWNGKKESEVTFTAKERIDPPPAAPEMAPAEPAQAYQGVQFKRSLRHGPAKWWWENGKLREEGEFKDDHRSGQWTEYSESGDKQAEGEYAHGLREGDWTFYDGADGSSRAARYHAGAAALSDEELPRLAAELASGEFQRQHAAMRQLVALGEAAAPTFMKELNTNDSRRRMLAIEGLIWLGPAAKNAAPQLESLAAGKNAEEQLWARVALGRCNSDRAVVMAGELWQEFQQLPAGKDKTPLARALVWLGQPALDQIAAALAQGGESGRLPATDAALALAADQTVWLEISRPPGAVTQEELSVVLHKAADEANDAASAKIKQQFGKGGFGGGGIF